MVDSKKEMELRRNFFSKTKNRERKEEDALLR